MKGKTVVLIIFCALFVNLTLFANPTHVSKIKTEKTYNKLAFRSANSTQEIISEVKIVYNISSKSLYFMDSQRFKFHFGFCKEVLGDRDELYTFRRKNYTKSRERKYYLASVVYFEKRKEYALKFASSDLINAAEITDCFQRIKANFFSDNLLIILPDNINQNEINHEKLKYLPIFRQTEITTNNFQPIVQKEAIGYLRKVYAVDLDFFSANTNDLLVIKGTPLDLPVAAGIITTDYQTPLSHLSVLAFNRSIPLMAYKKAWNDSVINKFENKLVKLTIQSDTFLISPITTVPDNLNSGNLKLPVKLPLYLSLNRIIKSQELKGSLISSVGGKAANFGHLNNIFNTTNSGSKIEIPSGAFAIPFYYYDQHIKKHQINILIDSLLKNIASENFNIQKILSTIRLEITSKPIDSLLLKNVESEIRLNIPSGRARFRSSTNAEDIDGFSGAGLYTSKTGIVSNNDKSIEKAIKEVWASLWNDKAFLERNLFHIDQHQLAMGILVHQSFPNELANGVAVTHNLFSKNEPGYTINLQKGELSVVTPDKGVECDQILAKKNGPSSFGYQFFGKSNKTNGEPVVTVNQLDDIVNGLQLIEKYYTNLLGTNCPKAFDVEFKLIEKNKKPCVIFKQVRPFNF